MKRVPIGIGTFPALLKDCCYVDKTLFLKELIDLPHTSALLITRPRRFGKSLMISTAQSYFDIEEADDGLFDGLAISKCGEKYKAEKHRYSVIRLSFKNLSANSKTDLLGLVGGILAKEYKRHWTSLDGSQKLSEEEMAFCRRIISQSAGEMELMASLGNLIAYLTEAAGTEVVVLLDEYDGILQAAFEGGFYLEMFGFCKVFYGVIKGNPHIRFSFITGVFEVAKESLSSCLNSPDVYTVLDERYSEYFGFTPEEARDLLIDYGLGESYEKAISWYGGYQFGTRSMVNPWGLLNFISRGGLYRPYWTNSSSSIILQTVLNNITQESLDELRSILEGIPIISEIDPTVTFLSLSSPSSTLSTLVFLGYLTISGQYEDSYIYNLLIPNEEVRSIFRKEILNHTHLGGISAVMKFRAYMKSGDENGLRTFLEETVLPSLSYYDFSSENAYQALVLGMVTLCFDEFKVESEVNSGEGRCDIMLTPKEKGQLGMVIELKSLKYQPSAQRFRLSAENALRQIREKGYAEKLFQTGVRRVLCYGISFYRKRSEVAFEEITDSVN